MGARWNVLPYVMPWVIVISLAGGVIKHGPPITTEYGFFVLAVELAKLGWLAVLFRFNPKYFLAAAVVSVLGDMLLT